MGTRGRGVLEQHGTRHRMDPSVACQLRNPAKPSRRAPRPVPRYPGRAGGTGSRQAETTTPRRLCRARPGPMRAKMKSRGANRTRALQPHWLEARGVRETRTKAAVMEGAMPGFRKVGAGVGSGAGGLRRGDTGLGAPSKGRRWIPAVLHPGSSHGDPWGLGKRSARIRD